MATNRIPASRWALAFGLAVFSGIVLCAPTLLGSSNGVSPDDQHAQMRRDVLFSTMSMPASMSSLLAPTPTILFVVAPPTTNAVTPVFDPRAVKVSAASSPTATPKPTITNTSSSTTTKPTSTNTTNSTASKKPECSITGRAELEDWMPLCNTADLNETAMGLRNRLLRECLYANEENEISVGDCKEVNYTRVCIDPCTLEVKSVDGRCFGVANGDPEEMEERLSLVECDSEYQGRWVFGGLDAERLVNHRTGFCADVEHQHHNGPVITWKCKPRSGYQPQNQAWLWY